MPFLDHFGLIAPLYDRLFGFLLPEKLTRFLDLPVAGRILDAGGGTGRVAVILVPHAAQVVVADLSYNMLAQAREKKGVVVVQCAAEALPFPQGVFDRVLMVDALHHVADRPRTIAELWRALKPGGKVVIEEPDIHTLSARLIAIFEKLAFMRSHFLSPEEIAFSFGKDTAGTKISREGYTAWIVAEKHISG